MFGWLPSADGARRMLDNTIFSLAEAGPMQVMAFIGFVIATIAFCVWLVYLVRT